MPVCRGGAGGAVEWENCLVGAGTSPVCPPNSSAGPELWECWERGVSRGEFSSGSARRAWPGAGGLAR